jgi:peptidoglycan biosynthesis protein MviN/MurJ (putative lipid II flippase)
MFQVFRRNPRKPGWWTYALLNIGLILRALAEPIDSMQPNPFSGWALVLSAIIQFLAGLLFVINSWGRVKEK